MALSNKNADNTDELSPRTPKKNSQLCNGISTSGKHCKRLVANGEYCGYHKTNSILEDIGIKHNYTMLKKTNLLVELSSSERITSDSLSNNSLVDCENKDVASSLKIGLKTSTIQSIDNPSSDNNGNYKDKNKNSDNSDNNKKNKENNKDRINKKILDKCDLIGDSVDSIDDDYIFAPIESPPNDISESPIVLGDDNKKLKKKKDKYDEVDWFKTSSLNNTKYYNSSFYKSLKSAVTLEENHIDSIVDKFNTLYIDEKNNLNYNVIDKEFAESISPYDLTPKKNGILETKTLTSYKKTPSSHEKPKRSTLVDDNFDDAKSPSTYVTPTRFTSLFVNFDQIEDDLLSSCSPSKSPKNFQCNGYTQNGKKCKNKIKASQYYCYNHKPEKSKIDLENLFIPTNDTNGIWIRTDVGRTKNIIRRMNEWKNQCKYKLQLIDWFPSTGGLLISQKTENADEINGNNEHKDLERQKIMKSCKFTHRAERLIHLELSEKFKAESSKCLFCEKIHREIFKIDITSVVETTETKVKTAETALIKDDKELPGLEEIRNVIIKWVKYIEEVYGPD
nr:980_t:CDS:2 [Entrophospora candida]